MGDKLQANFLFNWQATTPIPFVPNTPLSGVTTGAMASTNTIYTNIYDVRRLDNLGLEITWTGTPTGTISVLGSASGIYFYALTFNPVLTQPTGSGGGYLVDLNQFPWRFLLLEYVNSSGTGSLTIWLQTRDLN